MSSVQGEDIGDPLAFPEDCGRWHLGSRVSVSLFGASAGASLTVSALALIG